MAERYKHETRFPLGGNMYICLRKWKGRATVHIRVFKTIPSPLQHTKTIVVPSNIGIELSPSQLKQMELSLPCVVSELKSMTVPLPPNENKENVDPSEMNQQNQTLHHEPFSHGEKAVVNNDGPARTVLQQRRSTRSTTSLKL